MQSRAVYFCPVYFGTLAVLEIASTQANWQSKLVTTVLLIHQHAAEAFQRSSLAAGQLKGCTVSSLRTA